MSTILSSNFPNKIKDFIYCYMLVSTVKTR